MSALLEGLTASRVGLVALALFVASALYTGHLSGLAKVPGPWHARYSGGWLFGKILGGTRCFAAEAMHEVRCVGARR